MSADQPNYMPRNRFIVHDPNYTHLREIIAVGAYYYKFECKFSILEIYYEEKNINLKKFRELCKKKNITDK